MRKLSLLIIICTLIPLLHGCKKGDLAGNKLIGEWNIDVYRRSQIHSDGTETITQDETDVGFWRFYRESGTSTRSFVDYETTYTGTPSHSMSGTVFIGDEGKRMIFPHFYCNGIGCDMVYTIQELSNRRMVLELFTPNGVSPPNNSGQLVPGNNPNSEDMVVKLRMELRKK